MSLELKVQQAMKTAMMAKDQASLRTLRAIKSAILLMKTEKGFDGNVSPEMEISLLQKLLKQRKDSFKIFQEQNRTDLAEKEQEEIEVIEQFLPEQMSEENLSQVLKELVAETGASSMKDMGRLVGLSNQKLAGQAEGQVIARILKSLLQ